MILESPHLTTLKIMFPQVISLGISWVSEVEAVLRVTALGVSTTLSVLAYLRAQKKRKDEKEAD